MNFFLSPKELIRQALFSEDCVRYKRLETIYNHTFQFTGLCFPDGTIIDANETSLAPYNITRTDVCGKPFWEGPWWEGDEVKENIRRAFDEVRHTKKMVRMNVTHPSGTGNYFYVDFSLTPVLNENDDVQYIIPEGRNDTDYQALLQGFESLHETAPIGLATNDFETGKFLRVNPAFCKIVGYSEAELSTMTYWDITPADYEMSEKEQLEHIKTSGGYGPYNKEYIHRDGHRVPVTLSGTKFADRTGRKVIWSIVQDVSERVEQESLIYNLAYYDTLTGLPNRARFIEMTKTVIEHARTNGWRAALFLIDLDDFKRINDTFGHLAGDALLKEIAIRLDSVVQEQCDGVGPEFSCNIETTSCNCFAARLGGDEFVVVLEHVDDISVAERAAKNIFKAFNHPVLVDEQEIYTKLSIGIGMYPHDGTSVSALLKSADLALYSAKEKGKNQYHFHEASMNIEVIEHFQYENALRYFIDTEDFDVHYQPIVDVKDGSICGAETLFRGNHLKYSDMHLDRMINIAEESGMIIPLGNAIFRRACEDCVRCIHSGHNAVVSVNVSIRELDEPLFAENVLQVLVDTGLPPSNLAIEVTESLFMINYKENIRKLKKLKDAGIYLSIDDFGKGYSSMSYLRQLPADKLKIDKEFIDHIAEDRKSEEIVRGITLMAQTLGMVVCAEGVETDEQFRILREIGVDQIQGYLTGRPVPLSVLFQMMED